VSSRRVMPQVRSSARSLIAVLPAVPVAPPGPQRLGLVLEDEPAVVDDHDLLEQGAQLVDQVGRDHDRARAGHEVGQQLVVEGGPRRGVHPQVGLVEQGDRGPGGQPDDHPEVERWPSESSPSFLPRGTSKRSTRASA
jgi:hypothetical protein